MMIDININERINNIEDNITFLNDKIEEILKTLHFQKRVIEDFSEVVNQFKMQNTKFI